MGQVSPLSKMCHLRKHVSDDTGVLFSTEMFMESPIGDGNIIDIKLRITSKSYLIIILVGMSYQCTIHVQLAVGMTWER